MLASDFFNDIASMRTSVDNDEKTCSQDGKVVSLVISAMDGAKPLALHVSC
jgi:hypothetical protein